MRNNLIKIATLLTLLCVAVFAQEKGSFKDSRDGKTYKTVKIGNQIWMAENLDYAGENGNFGICLGNDLKNCQKYGRLYKWKDAMLACPDGWHLPEYGEWQTLVDFTGGETAGRKLKAKNGWEKWDCEKTTMDDRGRTIKISKCNSDNYGFSALPGSWQGNSNGNFSNGGKYGSWWSATESSASNALGRGISYNNDEVDKGQISKTYFFSVRCLRD